MSEVPRDGMDLDLDPEWIWICFFLQELSGTTIWIRKKVSDPDSRKRANRQPEKRPTITTVALSVEGSDM